MVAKSIAKIYTNIHKPTDYRSECSIRTNEETMPKRADALNKKDTLLEKMKTTTKMI